MGKGTTEKYRKMKTRQFLEDLYLNSKENYILLEENSYFHIYFTFNENMQHAITLEKRTF